MKDGKLHSSDINVSSSLGATIMCIALPIIFHFLAIPDVAKIISYVIFIPLALYLATITIGAAKTKRELKRQEEGR